jgi:hypothetical protein
MNCEICEQLNGQYGSAVSDLHTANQHLRHSKAGSLEAALSRRQVHQSLNNLIAAEAELKSHKSWHIGSLTALQVATAPEAAASL